MELETFKNNIISGYYQNHKQGVSLLDIDIENLELNYELQSYFKERINELQDEITSLENALEDAEDEACEELQDENEYLKSRIKELES